MKIFRKKKIRSPESRPRPALPDSDQNIYSQYATSEAPLDEYSDGRRSQQTRRTSRHNAARRREVSNRVSRWAITFLLLRVVLIILLLVSGFIVLRLVLDRIKEPSEKEKKQWEVNAVRMEQIPASAGMPVSPELVVNATLIEQRLGQWNRTAQLLRSAEALYQQGINEEAAQRLGQALRIMPDNREAQQQLFDIYMHLGRYDEAVPLSIRLLDQGGQQPDLQMNLLRALQESGQIDAGLVLANRMLLDQPNNEEVLSIAASGLVQQGKTDAALVLFERMLENSAMNTVALERCGKIYFDRGDYEQAGPYYLELVRLEPKPEYYQMLACSYAQQKQAGKTVVFMGQAASLFGGGKVAPWLKEPGFDPVRESIEFRSFADQLVGTEKRKAIEAINKHEAEKPAPAAPDKLEFLRQPEMNAGRPGK